MRLLLTLVIVACGPSPTPTPVSPPTPARYRGPIIDFHAHFAKPADVAVTTMPDTDLRTLDDQAGVTQSALIVMAQKGDPAATRRMNDELLAATTASGGRFFAVASVHPADGKDALDELTRLAGLGVRVIKLHPNTQKLDVAAPEVAAVVARAAELGLVLVFDGYSPFDADQPGKFAILAISHPTARIVLAHIGGPKFDDMILFAILRQFSYYQRNIWFDLSVTAHTFADSPYEDELVWATRAIGTDRIVFGSDYPVETPAHAVEDLIKLGYTTAEQKQILHDNAAALLAPN